MTTPAATPATAPSQLIFYKLFTPKWLEDNASLGFSQKTSNETELQVPSDVKENESILQINLLKHGALNNDDDIVVKVKAGIMSPMIFTLWCPGEDDGMGIQINDSSDYTNSAFGPFRGVDCEASGWSLSDVQPMGSRQTKTSYHFSEMVEFTYAPNTYYKGAPRLPWATACNAVDSGTFDAYAPYHKNLKLSKGLNLGIYRGKVTNQCVLKSLEVYIYKNGKDVHGK